MVVNICILKIYLKIIRFAYKLLIFEILDLDSVKY